MGKTYESIDDRLAAWIDQQPLFFVATAPLSQQGHVNVSPKGMAGTFRVVGPTRVAYLDLVGSGIETVAHLRENGRITLMFCAFAGPPKILRLYGHGTAVSRGDAGFDALLASFAPSPDIEATIRSVIVIDVERISDSCGWGVPLMEVVGERDQLFRNATVKREKEGDGWVREYVARRNARSIDGLAGFEQGADER